MGKSHVWDTAAKSPDFPTRGTFPLFGSDLRLRGGRGSWRSPMGMLMACGCLDRIQAVILLSLGTSSDLDLWPKGLCPSEFVLALAGDLRESREVPPTPWPLRPSWPCGEGRPHSTWMELGLHWGSCFGFSRKVALVCCLLRTSVLCQLFPVYYFI